MKLYYFNLFIYLFIWPRVVFLLLTHSPTAKLCVLNHTTDNECEFKLTEKCSCQEKIHKIQFIGHLH